MKTLIMTVAVASLMVGGTQLGLADKKYRMADRHSAFLKNFKANATDVTNSIGTVEATIKAEKVMIFPKKGQQLTATVNFNNGKFTQTGQDKHQKGSGSYKAYMLKGKQPAVLVVSKGVVAGQPVQSKTYYIQMKDQKDMYRMYTMALGQTDKAKMVYKARGVAKITFQNAKK